MAYELLHRWFHRSKWWTRLPGDRKGDIDTFIPHSSTYRRPIAKTIKGKLRLKHFKRQKVRHMKEAGHLRGDNRPF